MAVWVLPPGKRPARFWTIVDWACGDRKEMASFFSTDISLLATPPDTPRMTTQATRTTHLVRLPVMKAIIRST